MKCYFEVPEVKLIAGKETDWWHVLGYRSGVGSMVKLHQRKDDSHWRNLTSEDPRGYCLPSVLLM